MRIKYQNTFLSQHNHMVFVISVMNFMIELHSTLLDSNIKLGGTPE